MQLGASLGGVISAAATASASVSARVVRPRRQVTFRYPVPDVFNGRQPNFFAVRVRLGDGEIITSLIQVGILGRNHAVPDPDTLPVTTLASLADVAAPGFPPDVFFLFGVSKSFQLDFEKNAYFVEVVMSRPGSIVSAGIAPAVAAIQLHFI